ncbi:DHH family phosphoesterase [Mycoplasmopsis synoviae]|nr:hypothetical protein [Mycoplasmopsis synoviae]
MKIGSTKIALEAIEKYQNIIILHHIRPDGDCLGSQFGLAELIKTNYPNKKFIVLEIITIALILWILNLIMKAKLTTKFTSYN